MGLGFGKVHWAMSNAVGLSYKCFPFLELEHVELSKRKAWLRNIKYKSRQNLYKFTYILDILFIFSIFRVHSIRGPKKMPKSHPIMIHTYFDFALGISYKVLFPVLDRPTAQFKTARTKFRNIIELSMDIVKQIWNIFCEWEIIMYLFGAPNKIKSRNWGNKVPLTTIHILYRFL